MNNIRITDDAKIKKDNIYIIGFSILLLILFILGLVRIYEKGFIDGLNTFCDYDLGITNEGEYICYNKTTYYDEEDIHVKNFNLGWEG